MISLRLNNSSNKTLIVGPLAPEQCIIYRPNKTSKSGSGYEKLVTCITTASTGLLQLFEQSSSDSHVIAQFSTVTATSENIAREFKYHRSCNYVDQVKIHRVDPHTTKIAGRVKLKPYFRSLLLTPSG